MIKSKISATILAHSISPQDIEIATMKLVFPRYILAELNTHRVFSKNSASSRAIPYKKMRDTVRNNTFSPIAWQKDHKGMQGVEYWKRTDRLNPINNDKDYSIDAITHFENEWLAARDMAMHSSDHMSEMGLTKQLCNRLLEPFMWHTVILTATEFENFFKLRSPQYEDPEGYLFKSREEYALNSRWSGCEEWDEEGWFECSRSQAEIHIQALADAMWEALHTSKPTRLEAGEWHIPFGDNIDENKLHAESLYIADYGGVHSSEVTDYLKEFNSNKLKIATARCARISYETLGDDPKIDYAADIRLHDMLLKEEHMSPFEHCAQAMSNEEFKEFTRTVIDKETKKPIKQEGWLANFRGFKQYRCLL